MKKILVVDDMEENLYMLESLLTGSGHEVITSKNGVEALESLKNHSFDLIISDILMPVMDGFQLCRKCKSNDKTKSIPFIFYTATYTDKKDEQFALSLGAARFVVKPLEPTVLMEIIESTLKDYKNGLIISPEIPVEEDAPEFLKEYNERLVRKLESKMLELEKQSKILQQVNEDLGKALEQEAALRDQLVKAERLVSIGEMATKIAHEINNPLTVIMGQAQLQLISAGDEKTKNSFNLIFKNAEEVSQLTRRYMDLGKPVDTKLEPINLGEVLKNTVISLSALGQLKKIKLSEKYLDKEQKVLGNQHMMGQVFRNLIINAIQASNESKDAEILLGTRLGKDGRVIEAFVSDKGVGIKAEEVEKIFDYYYTTKEEGTGTGLGLVICKEIVETAHGGRINVLSSEGVGTTFTIELPTLEYSIQKKKIMIVDDEAYIAELFGTYLSQKGFLIHTCNRGEEALRIYPEFMPDLVLTDYDMPEMTGLELYKKIKEIKDDQPFVMITGAFLSSDDLKYLKEQKIPQLIKPANLETELLETVKQQLESD